MIADGAGRVIALRIAPGEAYELPDARTLLDRLPGVARWVVADRRYFGFRFGQQIANAGAKPAIPNKRNDAPVSCPD